MDIENLNYKSTLFGIEKYTYMSYTKLRDINKLTE